MWEISPAFCSIPAATVTLERRVPSIWARSSCVRGTEFDPTRSELINSHRASRSLTSCRRLQAAICVTCMAMIWENCCSRRSSLGHWRRAAISVSLSTRNADASIWAMARVDAVRKPTTRGDADETFLADQTNFHALSVREDTQDGNQATVAEVSGPQSVAGFVQYVVGL